MEGKIRVPDQEVQWPWNKDFRENRKKCWRQHHQWKNSRKFQTTEKHELSHCKGPSRVQRQFQTSGDKGQILNFREKQTNKTSHKQKMWTGMTSVFSPERCSKEAIFYRKINWKLDILSKLAIKHGGKIKTLQTHSFTFCLPQIFRG